MSSITCIALVDAFCRKKDFSQALKLMKWKRKESILMMLNV